MTSMDIYDYDRQDVSPRYYKTSDEVRIYTRIWQARRQTTVEDVI